jgi:hypothetical protein
VIFNAELGLRVLDEIRSHPDRWDQEHWFGGNTDGADDYTPATACGTTACFAGHVLIAHYATAEPDMVVVFGYDDSADVVLRNPRDGDITDQDPLPNDRYLGYPAGKAADALGVPLAAIDPLFGPEVTLAALEAGVEFLATVDGTRPEHDDWQWVNSTLNKTIGECLCR